MPDTNSPTPVSACLAALKTAIAAERQVLALDSHSASARTEALLVEALCEAFPVSDSIVVISKEHGLMYGDPAL